MTATVAVLLAPAMRRQMLSADAERALAGLAEIRAPGGEELTEGRMASLLDGAEACLTGWGTPNAPASCRTCALYRSAIGCSATPLSP